MFYTQAEAADDRRARVLALRTRSAHLFFQLVARRYERGSMLITTNQLVTQWGAVFGDDVLAAAILDRLLHHSHTLMIQGESYRLRQKKKAGLLGRAPGTTADHAPRPRAASDHCGRSPALPARADLREQQTKRGSVLVSDGGQFLLSLDTAGSASVMQVLSGGLQVRRGIARSQPIPQSDAWQIRDRSPTLDTS